MNLPCKPVSTSSSLGPGEHAPCFADVQLSACWAHAARWHSREQKCARRQPLHTLAPPPPQQVHGRAKNALPLAIKMALRGLCCYGYACVETDRDVVYSLLCYSEWLKRQCASVSRARLPQRSMDE